MTRAQESREAVTRAQVFDALDFDAYWCPVEEDLADGVQCITRPFTGMHIKQTNNDEGYNQHNVVIMLLTFDRTAMLKNTG